MDSRKYLALSLCFLFLFPDLSHSNIQLPGWLGDNKMCGSLSFSLFVVYVFVKMPLRMI